MTETNLELNETLRQIDAEQIAKGAPILSVMVQNDAKDDFTHITWESIEKYNLRKPNENDDELVTRLIKEAQDWAKNKEAYYADR